jgi:hypothetical protein
MHATVRSPRRRAIKVAVTVAIVAAACSRSWRDYLGDTARNMWKPTALQ